MQLKKHFASYRKQIENGDRLSLKQNSERFASRKLRI